MKEESENLMVLQHWVSDIERVPEKVGGFHRVLAKGRANE